MRRAVRAFVFFAVTALSWIGLWLAWARIVVWTGGATSECDRGDCGTLGELTYGELGETWPVVPVAMLGAALLVAWALDRGVR